MESGLKFINFEKKKKRKDIDAMICHGIPG